MEKNNLPTVTGEVELDDGLLSDSAKEARQMVIRAEEVAARVGYAGALTIDALDQRIDYALRRTAEAAVELGVALLVLKELTPFGEFLERVERRGISPRMAQKFMAAAWKFSNANSSSVLLAAGSQTKILELAVLDDGEIEALSRGETVSGLDLDGVEAMSCSELKAALRQARAEVDELKGDAIAKDELLSDKNKLLDKERAKNKRIQAASPDEVLAELQAEATRMHNDVRGAIVGQMRQALIALRDHAETQGQGGATVFMAGLVGQLCADLVALRDEFGLPDVDAGEHGWVDEA